MKSDSKLEKVLSEGKFGVTCELGPPQHADPDNISKKAEHLKGNADAVNITDNQTAIVRMSSIAASKLAIDAGLEPVAQMVCRDRNRIAMQSDILGAAALGIKNILLLSGDHQTFGNHPEASNVYDLDSINLIQMVKNMRDEKIFQSGDPIKEHEPRMFIGAVENPFADPFEFRVARLAKKANAGADFIQTQCIFDMNRFKEWMKMVVDRGIHERLYILAGITPVRSHKALVYMNKNVAGITVPEELIKRMEDADEPKEEGVKVAIEQIQEIQAIEGVAGLHLMPIGWESITSVIMEKTGLLPRP